MAGMSLPFLNATGAAATPTKAKSVIYVFLNGGLSQYDSFNVEVDKPVLGKSTIIKSNADGVRVSHYYPKLAKQMDQLLGYVHPDADNESWRECELPADTAMHARIQEQLELCGGLKLVRAVISKKDNLLADFQNRIEKIEDRRRPRARSSTGMVVGALRALVSSRSLPCEDVLRAAAWPLLGGPIWSSNASQ